MHSWNTEEQEKEWQAAFAAFRSLIDECSIKMEILGGRESKEYGKWWDEVAQPILDRWDRAMALDREQAGRYFMDIIEGGSARQIDYSKEMPKIG